MARVHHWQEDWASYHVTTRTVDKAFHLVDEKDKRIVICALDFYQRRGEFDLFGYVVMGNHVHLVLQPSPGRRLADVMRDFKKWTSRCNAAKAPGQPLWERRYDDNLIRTPEEMLAVLAYIHSNPVRAGIVEDPSDYPWSSARDYAGRDDGVLEVTTNWR